MATHKSAEKRARQSIKRSARNTQTLSALTTWEKKLKTVLATKDATAAQDLLKEYKSKLGKAAQKGVLHVKAASRKISRASKNVSALSK